MHKEVLKTGKPLEETVLLNCFVLLALKILDKAVIKKNNTIKEAVIDR